jgi:hypothetical protein
MDSQGRHTSHHMSSGWKLPPWIVSSQRKPTLNYILQVHLVMKHLTSCDLHLIIHPVTIVPVINREPMQWKVIPFLRMVVSFKEKTSISASSSSNSISSAIISSNSPYQQSFHHQPRLHYHQLHAKVVHGPPVAAPPPHPIHGSTRFQPLPHFYQLHGSCLFPMTIVSHFLLNKHHKREFKFVQSHIHKCTPTLQVPHLV